MPAKVGDFVLVDYTGRTADGAVFDTTDAATARAAGIWSARTRYRPALIVVGKGRALTGLEEAIEGMEVGEEKDVAVPPAKGFGERKEELISVIAAARFRAEGIIPEVGALVTIDDRDGIIRSISGGRVVVDFNHPLAGKELRYHIKLLKIIEGKEERLAAILDDTGLRGKISAREDSAKAELEADVSMDYVIKKQALLKWIADFMPEIKNVEIAEKYKTEKVRRELATS